jgi:quercetin dioxygenase-like cupin family protein
MADSELHVVDLIGLARREGARGPVWTAQSDDLNVNLLVFGAGEGIEAHVNTEVDVLLVGIDGAGTVEIDGTAHPLQAGELVTIPKGARRAIRAGSDRFAYLTCHRRRSALLPAARRHAQH